MADDEDFNNRRKREAPGRRAEDYLYESLVDRLRRLEDRFERTIDKIEASFERLYRAIDKSEEKLETKVNQLEGFHLEDQAETRMRVTSRARQMETWQKWSIVFGILTTLIALIALVVSVTQ